jgi:hypothetical protein
MSPKRSPKTGLTFNDWVRRQAVERVAKYRAAVNAANNRKRTQVAMRRSLPRLRRRAASPPYSPKTSAALMRRRQTARRSVSVQKRHTDAMLERDIARIERMLAQIENYKTRQPVLLVRQPSGSLSMARGVRGSARRN